jgi:DNA-binding response OmpR family regulator
MRATKVLLIENARNNGVTFAPSLKRKYQVQIAHSGKQGLAMALDKQPDVIVLDAVSLRTSGDRICGKLRAGVDETPIIHIRPKGPPPGGSLADTLLTPPFTARKLINRIDRFVVPAEGKILEAGPFSLNLEQQTLTAPWTEKKLTPKLVTLMELFMQNLNRTLERKHIMQQVWKTDYMGDTRTLDVHIRWIRKIVEPDPRKPQYIMTVRGVGYRFAVPEPQVDAAEPGTKADSRKPPKLEVETA